MLIEEFLVSIINVVKGPIALTVFPVATTVLTVIHVIEKPLKRGNASRVIIRTLFVTSIANLLILAAIWFYMFTGPSKSTTDLSIPFLLFQGGILISALIFIVSIRVNRASLATGKPSVENHRLAKAVTTVVLYETVMFVLHPIICVILFALFFGGRL